MRYQIIHQFFWFVKLAQNLLEASGGGQSLVVVLFSFVRTIQDKCSDRTKIVMKIFKEEEQLKAAGTTEKERIERQAL